MSVLTEFEFKIAQDEFTFFRSQQQQSWLMAVELALLAIVTSAVIQDFQPYSGHASEMPFQSMHLLIGFYICYLFAWCTWAFQALHFVWPDRKEFVVPDRLQTIINQAAPQRPLANEAEQAITEMVRVLLTEELKAEAIRLRNRRNTRMTGGMITLVFVIGLLVINIFFVRAIHASGFVLHG